MHTLDGRVGRAAKLLPCAGLMEVDMTLHAFLHHLVLLIAAIALITLLDRHPWRKRTPRPH